MCPVLSLNKGYDMAVDYLGKNNPDGMSFGSATTEKISFYGITPVAQRSGSTQAAVSTTAATQSSPYGYSTSTQANAIVSLVNELRAACVALGIIKGSA